jgi:hypothetical protein
MDPLSIIGLVASVQQLADRIVVVIINISNYISKVKDARPRSEELQHELRTVSRILHALAEFISNHSIPYLTPHLLKAVTDFNQVLDKMEKQVNPDSVRGFRRFLRPFREDDFQCVLQKIERSKSTFNLALHLHETFGHFFQ